jgi:branched-chain amino acid transport system ATP-binding protein
MFDVKDVSVRFGGVVALNDVTASFTQPVSGIIGPNGAGKTTLMNVISGFVHAQTGRIEKDGQNLLDLAPHRRAHWGLRRSFQKEEIANDLTALENVLVQIDHAGDRSDKSEAMQMLELVGMADKAAVLGQSLNTFERRLTDLAKSLVGKPKLIMLDEPGGSLSKEETEILGDLILAISKETGAQTLVIDHDVDFIRKICTETLVLDFGCRIAFGATAEILADPKVKAAYLGTEEV